MSRLSPLPPDSLDPEQRVLYDAVLAGPRRRAALVEADGSLRGPFGPMLLSPELGDRLQALGAAVRFSTVLRADVRELATLVVAAHWRCRFEWEAHLPLAAAAGLDPEVVAPLWEGGEVVVDDPVLQVVLACSQEVVARQRVSSPTYEAGRALLGERQLFELWTLLGYYATLAGVLNGFEIES